MSSLHPEARNSQLRIWSQNWQATCRGVFSHLISPKIYDVGGPTYFLRGGEIKRTYLIRNPNKCWTITFHYLRWLSKWNQVTIARSFSGKPKARVTPSIRLSHAESWPQIGILNSFYLEKIIHLMLNRGLVMTQSRRVQMVKLVSQQKHLGYLRLVILGLCRQVMHWHDFTRSKTVGK